MEDVLVPIVMFGAIVGIVWLVSYFNHRKRQVTQETLKLAIQNGQTLSPELIERLSQATDPKKADMRRFVIIGSIAIALCAIAFVAPIEDTEGIRGVLAAAVVPAALALAYLGLWRFGHER